MGTLLYSTGKFPRRTLSKLDHWRISLCFLTMRPHGELQSHTVHAQPSPSHSGGADRLNGGRPRLMSARLIERSTISNVIPYVFFKYLAVVIYNIIEVRHSCGAKNLDL